MANEWLKIREGFCNQTGAKGSRTQYATLVCILFRRLSPVQVRRTAFDLENIKLKWNMKFYSRKGLAVCVASQIKHIGGAVG
jgi:hypothetical protein